MKELILVLIPIVISGLGFLSYKHPPIARKILIPSIYVLLGIAFLFQMNGLVRSNAYYKAKDIARSYIVINESKMPELHFTQSKDEDSILIAEIERKYEFDKYFEIQQVKSSISDSIQNKISTIIKAQSSADNTYLLYCGLAFVIINVLIGLSFLFDNIHRKEKVANDNNPRSSGYV
jgi:hypothetical protein